MKIFYLNHSLRLTDAGPKHHAIALADALEKAGATVVPFPPEDPSVEPSASFAGGFLRAAKNIVPFELRRFIAGCIRTVRTFWPAIAAVRRERPHFLLARHYDYEWLPWIVARLTGLPLILEVNAPFFIERRLSDLPSPPVLRWMERVQWNRSDAIYCVSKPLKRLLEREGIPAEQIWPIPNGVDANDFVGVVPTERSQTRIVFTGGFYPWHGVRDLLKAFVGVRSQFPESELWLIGDGPERAAVEAEIASNELGSTVRLFGRLSRTATVCLVAQAAIGVAPYRPFSDFYFSPLKIAEYMAGGLAVVAPRQGQITETIQDGVTGLLYLPGDIDSLQQALVELLKDPKRTETMGWQGRQAALSRMTWEVTATQLLAKLDSFARTSRSTTS